MFQISLSYVLSIMSPKTLITYIWPIEKTNELYRHSIHVKEFVQVGLIILLNGMPQTKRSVSTTAK